MFYISNYKRENQYQQFRFNQSDFCSSMLGYTKYYNHFSLCSLPCNIKSKYKLPIVSRGSCSSDTTIAVFKHKRSISFNQNGYITFLNFNYKYSFVVEERQIYVYKSF